MLADGSPLPPNECHRVLTASNPTYAALTIMQKPSWVHPPTSYTPGSVSSLSVAFEDPDGSKLKVLLAEHYLYAFGNRASVHKWKYHQKNPKDKSKSTADKHPNTGDANDEEDVDQLLSVKTYYCLRQAVGDDLVFEVEVIDPKNNQRDV